MSMLKVPVSSADHVQGPDGAVVTLVEYGDYECPFCKMAYPVVKRLQKHFGARLRFVFRNFPLRELHPHAQAAAETAEFAAVHGKFWEMHDLLYENQERLGDALLFELAEESETARGGADPGAGKRTLHGSRPRRLWLRRPQWSQRNPNLLHQWTSPRRSQGVSRTPGGRGGGRGVGPERRHRLTGLCWPPRRVQRGSAYSSLLVCTAPEHLFTGRAMRPCWSA